MSLRLRRILSRDLAPLARLHAACFPLDAWDATALAGLLAMRGASGRLAATEAGTIVGFLFDLVHGDEAEILTLGVDPPERRRGVARALLDDLFARARAAGAKRITLEVATDNAGALGLYRACGFRPVGERPGYYQRGAGPRIDAWLLSRELD
ncbi:MAG TPA: GNAT family N-acetyltransferase [Stellaceae bacterium]|nr:GNAT family N-acetyltransferase [Stellaceae bacterium]